MSRQTGCYLGIACLLLLLLALHARNGQWTGDMWEHSAVIKELATHPTAPLHPQLAVDAPHAFYTPYHWIVAQLSRQTSLSAMDALGVAGLANAALLLTGLFLFTRRLTGRPELPGYVLIFTLFLWGISPWSYSGFFHIGVLAYVSPYSSTFAMGVSLIGLWLFLRFRDLNEVGPLVAAAPVPVIVLLSHPLTFLFFAMGLGALALENRNRRVLNTCVAVALVGSAFAFATCWPLYPFFELIGSGNRSFHEGNKEMYDGLISRIAPALLGIPFLFWRLRSNRVDALVLLFLGTSILYAYGAATESWSYGRLIASLVLVLHIALANGILALADWLRYHGSESVSRVAPHMPLALVTFVCLTLGTRTLQVAQRSLPGATPVLTPYAFLYDYVGQYEAVLADLKTSFIIPAIAGKVVSVPRALAFIPDAEQRRADVATALHPGTPKPARDAIIARYGVDWLLFDKRKVPYWESIVAVSPARLETVYEDNFFRLLKVHSMTEE